MAKLCDHLAERIAARTKSKPLGRRQQLILAYARMRIAGGQTFPNVAEIAAFMDHRHSVTDIESSMLGLAARGLIASTHRVARRRGTFPSGWQITDAGWAA